MEFIQIAVDQRSERGKGPAGRLRAAGRVPAVLYGLGRRNMPLTMELASLEAFLESGSQLVELKMEDQTRPAILREIQQDPLTDRILHVDFVRVDKDVAIETPVPVHTKGMPKGVAVGGIFEVIRDELEVSARPADLPREILLDVSGLEIGDDIRIGDIEVPEGVTFLEEPELVVAHCIEQRIEELPEEAEEEEAEAAGEPELIGKDEEGEGDDEDEGKAPSKQD